MFERWRFLPLAFPFKFFIPKHKIMSTKKLVIDVQPQGIVLKYEPAEMPSKEKLICLPGMLGYGRHEMSINEAGAVLSVFGVSDPVLFMAELIGEVGAQDMKEVQLQKPRQHPTIGRTVFYTDKNGTVAAVIAKVDPFKLLGLRLFTADTSGHGTIPYVENIPMYNSEQDQAAYWQWPEIK